MNKFPQQAIFLVCIIGLLLSCCSVSHKSAFNEEYSQEWMPVNEERLLDNLRRLASDAMQGRKVGTMGNKMARTYILEQLKDIKNVSEQKFKLASENKFGYNIIAEIKGTQRPDKILVVTAHYDHLGVLKAGKNRTGNHIYNGADDNASGTATLIEAAKYFQKNLPKNTLIFVFTDAEEHGLQGAYYFVKNFTKINQVVLNVNMDMISRSQSRSLNICGLRYNTPLANYLKNQPTNGMIHITKGHDGLDGKQDWTTSSDHYPFHKKGIPFLYFGVEDHKDYHKTTDSYENINPSFYVHASNYILNTLINLDQSIH